MHAKLKSVTASGERRRPLKNLFFNSTFLNFNEPVITL